MLVIKLAALEQMNMPNRLCPYGLRKTKREFKKKPKITPTIQAAEFAIA